MTKPVDRPLKIRYSSPDICAAIPLRCTATRRGPAVFRHEAVVLQSRYEVILMSSRARCRLRGRHRTR
ncbi:hypothetical protein DMH04_14405 [Kibdelosporangium aridum]|uniref:Uncharacterized protein n=1 Tax=Kibdelosporangium aridum TaxID=2030 RepID=A0A428ZEE9_KIBAR|nr:hypothetical protein DMH04_14405 [Kibdelosporangium aridum]